MRVAIAGAGAVGRSIAQALVDFRHKVLLIERARPNFVPDLVTGADWLLADACELESLQFAGIDTCDTVIAATGDDKSNLVFSYLAKTEFSVPRVVARVNHPKNDWMFDASWGVDIAVSTPRSLSDAVENATEFGELVQLISFGQGRGMLVDVTVPPGSELVGRSADTIAVPVGCRLVTVIHNGRVAATVREVEAGDTLVYVAPNEQIQALITSTLGPGAVTGRHLGHRAAEPPRPVPRADREAP